MLRHRVTRLFEDVQTGAGFKYSTVANALADDFALELGSPHHLK
jgi:hypothetical protein